MSTQLVCERLKLKLPSTIPPLSGQFIVRSVESPSGNMGRLTRVRYVSQSILQEQ